MKTAESEIEGEKQVSRYAIEQSTRCTEALLGLRAEVAALRAEIAVAVARADYLAGEAAVTRATLMHHGRALDVLQQDVGALRNDLIAIRREMIGIQQEVAVVRQELAAMRQDMATRQEVAAVRQDMATRQELAAVRQDMATRQELAAVRQDMAMQHAELLAAIRALAGGAAPPA